MATDATGAPTSQGIPKYNTSADAPSGLGFNAAMDAIDALIAGKVTKPVGIATGETMVWNGSAFVRSTVTNVGVTSLGSGTPDATKFLRGDGTWNVAGLKMTASAFSSGPPGSPTDGDIWIATAANGTDRWFFWYDASSSSTRKWVFLHGAPFITASGGGVLATQGGAYVNSGATYSVVRPGDYEAHFSLSLNGLNGQVNYGIGIDGATPTGTDVIPGDVKGVYSHVALAVGATSTIKVMHQDVTAGNTTSGTNRLLIRPVRVS